MYKGGLYVRTTLNPNYQRIALRSLKEGLEAYDMRHGWKGPVTTISADKFWLKQLSLIELPKGMGDWNSAVVLSVKNNRAKIGVDNGTIGHIPLSQLTWARSWENGEKLGPKIRRVSDVLKKGYVILVEKHSSLEQNGSASIAYSLRQIPEIEGAMVAMDPHTGRVLAMVGGYDYDKSEFNRAVDALRQPGSAFKLFVYLAALDRGFTPSTLILDAPFVIDQGPGLPKWRPANYTKKFYGPSTMRLGIEKSRNLMTVRLAQTVGIETIVKYARKFNILDNSPLGLSVSLGAVETSLKVNECLCYVG